MNIIHASELPEIVRSPFAPFRSIPNSISPFLLPTRRVLELTWLRLFDSLLVSLVVSRFTSRFASRFSYLIQFHFSMHN